MKKRKEIHYAPPFDTMEILKQQDEYGEEFEEKFKDVYDLGSVKRSMPEGCRACGGPYPDCLDSCPLGDPE